MHSYTSLRREQQQQRVTLYLNPEVNGARSSNDIATRVARSAPSMEEMVLHYENSTVDYHPFLQRLQREPVNPHHIWLIFMNINIAFVPYFTRWLAYVIAGVEDDRIRAILAHQLNEELGNGDADFTHRKLFEKLMIGIEPWRMDNFTDEMLIPGENFHQRLEEIYINANPYVGIGSVILMEIQAKQFDICLGKEFRKTDIDLAKIKWLILHEELEVDHANEALNVACFADDSGQAAATIEGARQARVASWIFFDELYRVCYGSSPG